MSEKLQKLQDYLNSNLCRKYIQHFISETEYSVIFVSKKDDKQQLCIDYQKLNAITWKNRYLLSLIEKLQKRLKKVKWFTKLNIQEKYYKICIKKKKMKNSFSNKIQTVWVSSYVIQTNKYISNISRVN